jgi:hypothetical protein
VKSTVEIASELEAQIHLGLSETRVSLLRRAHELEQEEVPGLDEIAAALRAHAARMGGRGEIPATDVLAVVEILREENLRESATAPHAEAREQLPLSLGQAAPAATAVAKKRGRPRKYPSADRESNSME